MTYGVEWRPTKLEWNPTEFVIIQPVATTRLQMVMVMDRDNLGYCSTKFSCVCFHRPLSAKVTSPAVQTTLPLV